MRLNCIKDGQQKADNLTKTQMLDFNILLQGVKAGYISIEENDKGHSSSKVNYASGITKSKVQDTTVNLSTNNKESRIILEETGPMSRIEMLDLSGVDTESINVCNLLFLLLLFISVFYHLVCIIV